MNPWYHRLLIFALVTIVGTLMAMAINKDINEKNKREELISKVKRDCDIIFVTLESRRYKIVTYECPDGIKYEFEERI